MSKKKDDGKLKASVVIDISVDENEFIEMFGDRIRAADMIPAVYLVKTLKRAAQLKMAELGIESLEVK